MLSLKITKAATNDGMKILNDTKCIQSTLAKTDTFGTGTKCPSERGVRLMESQIKGINKGRDQL